jgi:hypothetical protein
MRVWSVDVGIDTVPKNHQCGTVPLHQAGLHQRGDIVMDPPVVPAEALSQRAREL